AEQRMAVLNIDW
ncbi:hypothetical protein WJ66_04047, partial [Stenotrophomonas maltophilia WJ66]